MTINVKLRTAAAADPDLQVLLGTSPFRWYDSILNQGTVLPAVVAQQVSGGETYVLNGRNPMSDLRMQMTIWAADPEAGRAVAEAVLCFLNTFNAIGISGLVAYPNYVINQREVVFAKTNQPTYQIVLDVRIFNNANAA